MLQFFSVEVEHLKNVIWTPCAPTKLRHIVQAIAEHCAAAPSDEDASEEIELRKAVVDSVVKLCFKLSIIRIHY